MGGAMQLLFSLLLSYFVIILIVIMWLWSLDIEINVSAADTGSVGGAMQPLFSDAIASFCSYPCQSVSQSISESVSDW